jgi:hypothetical protein
VPREAKQYIPYHLTLLDTVPATMLLPKPLNRLDEKIETNRAKTEVDQ